MRPLPCEASGYGRTASVAAGLKRTVPDRDGPCRVGADRAGSEQTEPDLGGPSRVGADRAGSERTAPDRGGPRQIEVEKRFPPPHDRLMNKRPVCIICMNLMLLILIFRLAGVPVFGEPEMTDALRDKYASGASTSVTGTIGSRQKREKSTQYVLKDASLSDHGTVIRFENIRLTLTGETSVYITAGTPENPELICAGTALPFSSLSVGSEITAYGELSEIRPPGNPGQFDSRTYYACQRIFYEMFCRKVTVRKQASGFGEQLARLRNRVSGELATVMHAESAGVLSAMLLGDRSMLDAESRLNYQCGGIMHVLAVSGLHISLLGMAVYQLLLRIFILAGGLSHARIMQGVSAACAASVMTVYCLFTGSPVSAVRALLMFAVLLLSRVLQKSYDPLCSLCFSAILILITSPGYLFYAGFQLSFAAVLGAAGIYPELLKLVPESFWRKGSRKKNLLHNFVELVLCWCAVMSITLPLTAYYFFQIPLYSLISNVLVLPAMSLVMELGLIGSSLLLLSRRLAWLVLIPVDLLLQLFSFSTGKIRTLPCAMWTCGQPALWQLCLYYAGLLALLVLLKSGHSKSGKRKIRSRLAAAGISVLMTVILLIRCRPPFSLTMLDVGQGDSLVIRAGTSAFLVDGGSTSEDLPGKYRIIPYLESQGITELDGIFLSHGDSDHCNGIEELLNGMADHSVFMRVDRMYMPCWMKEDRAGIRIARECRNIGVPVAWVREGDCVLSGDLRLDVIHPLKEGGETEGNAGSMVLLLRWRDFSALLTGDLEGDGEKETIPHIPDVDYLKVGHHGSRYSTSEALLKAASPEICTISAPAESVYGHPHRETLERISAAGAAAWCTRDCGAITASWSRGGMAVRGCLKNSDTADHDS